ncbi:cytochrome P450 71B28 [Talaromyces proteolyticus]|uniref:Cytochrome P450 71B28 n=1 Tax=Talaromyces proteolyticus TaxID=1131652 RepID=A0AAD4KHS5_9EURO|nr:cytochrome P450 71B28 [Talaromyces proteolyticus]KAH8691502.1 cytochrome P450 71B28 [Talaromyces proteolyticus]
MTSISMIAVFLALFVIVATYFFLNPLLLSPLGRIPGPKSFLLTKWRLAYEDWKGTSTRTIHQLHQRYGPAVRIGPNEVSFNSLTALRTIYGPGSSFGRTGFYRMFDVYGRQNLFTFHSATEHGRRKKLLSHAYSKSVILKEPVTSMVEEKAGKYMSLIESEKDHISDIFSTLHYYSLDNITEFLYGKYGSTFAMEGSESHQALISDILDPARRRLSWFSVHLPMFTRWLYTRTGIMETILQPLLPMQKPATYTGIREFALQAYRRFHSDMMKTKEKGLSLAPSNSQGLSILERLWQHHLSHRADSMDDLQMASECADHFLAGLDTTSDTLMFLVWSLSQPRNRKFQVKLRREVLSLSGESLNKYGFPKASVSDQCTYLMAIIKETLRLYAPLPTFEPRSSSVDSVIDGYNIPAGTIVGMSPFTLHRNPEVFKDPLTFNPDRWLGPDAAEMNRWFWAFSSGGRMCIGLHLAMLEMTTLAATIYQKYQTSLAPGFENVTPGITARLEVFQDDRYSKMIEHTCLIKFEEFGR